MGVACTVLGATQLTAAVWRPAKDAADAKGARLRLFWQNWHAWVGRAVSSQLASLGGAGWVCVHGCGPAPTHMSWPNASLPASPPLSPVL